MASHYTSQPCCCCVLVPSSHRHESAALRERAQLLLFEPVLVRRAAHVVALQVHESAEATSGDACARLRHLLQQPRFSRRRSLLRRLLLCARGALERRKLALKVRPAAALGAARRTTAVIVVVRGHRLDAGSLAEL